MEREPQPTEDLRKLAEIIDSAEVGMLTTRDLNGCLRSRPLATLEVAEGGDLWFFTSVKSPKIAELEEDNRVCVTYARTGDQQYVSVSGRARILRDRERARALWSAWTEAWFPDGPDDPELVLVNVVVEQAEYWDAPGNFPGRTFGLLQAFGGESEPDFGENRKITVDGLESAGSSRQP